jgi:hypothetical protein
VRDYFFEKLKYLVMYKLLIAAKVVVRGTNGRGSNSSGRNRIYNYSSGGGSSGCKWWWW